MLIRLAASECDHVYVFVSLSDRIRPGEVPISGSDMHDVWINMIEPSLPNNVTVTYGGSPVAEVYKKLADADKGTSDDAWMLYGDPTDVNTNFPEKYLMKYCPRLYESGLVTTRPVERSSTVDVSGTKMRQFIQNGDFAAFAKHMPKSIDAKYVWDKLTSTAQRGLEPTKKKKAKA